MQTVNTFLRISNFGTETPRCSEGKVQELKTGLAKKEIGVW